MMNQDGRKGNRGKEASCTPLEERNLLCRKERKTEKDREREIEGGMGGDDMLRGGM